MFLKLPRFIQISVRLGLQCLGRAGQLFLLNCGVAHPLDLPNPVKLPCRSKGEGTPGAPGPACSSDTMHIIFRILGQIVVDHSLHVIHVNSSGCNIRGNQNICASVPETVHGDIPLMLRHVSVQPFRLKALPLQNLRKLVHLYLRIAENQAKSRLIIFQQTDTCSILILPLHPVIPLCHQRNRQLLRRHPDQPGIVLKPSRNLQDRLRHGGRKKRRLMLSRNLPQNQLHILPEAHIQHFVRLVQHHSIHIIQPDGMPAHMIHHPARRAHDDLYSSETDYLSADLLSTVDGKHLDPMHIFRYLPQLVRRLDSQLSGRAEDNTLQLPQLRINLLQQWNPKCRRFPRTGLRLPDHIMAL